MNIIHILLKIFQKFSFLILPLLIACNHPNVVTIPSFPGAEGFGSVTSGGRGGRAMMVENLNDGGPGSLREAIESKGKRIVIFRISGTIILQAPLIIKNDDITIAGQTAPGDGICLRDYPLIIDADNVIIRYIRCRLGDKHKLVEDAISATGQENIMIDHCSFSWGIDEVASFYDNRNTTVQWCIISESLYHSYHHKGNHGYAGIWGGMNASFHHNLIAHHSSRTPRFQGSRYHGKPENELVDFRNNVIYNWGHNSSYGGESGKQNLISNYYKYGPASKQKNRIVEPWDAHSRWYISDNFVFGFPEISADNWAGGVQGEYKDFIEAKFPFLVEKVLTYSAKTAFEVVLSDAGSVLPSRDRVDKRIIEEVRNGSATHGGKWGDKSGIVDSQSDVGGWPFLNSLKPSTDGDRDGIPDNWEVDHGLDPSDPSDGNSDIYGHGYTNLEYYLDYLTVRDDFILPPAEISINPLSSTEIQLSWQDNCISETGFSIDRLQGDNKSIKKTIVEPNVICYIDSGLIENTFYSYRIKSFTNKIYSIYSEEVKVRTLSLSDVQYEN